MERKLTAILCADVFGYSRLMGEDEESTLLTLSSHRKLIDSLIQQHHGRFVNSAGDSVLAEFASVVNAVQCAVEVQATLKAENANLPPERRMEFRIGINLGDVMVDGEQIYGDGVNVAARLESLAEPGGICISNTVHDHVRGKVAVEFADLGEQSLKNIERPVRAHRVVSDRVGPNAPAAASSAPRFSMVVLPFANLGGDPEQEYFVDGVTESLTTDLSRITGISVIARNSAFYYKGQSPDVRQIGRELGVRYVLEGSVQRGSNRMRVNVQLIDAETGNHLWAERFDKPVADFFDMQDEIVARLAGQLGTQLVGAEARRAERSPHPDSMDLCFQGIACVHKGWSPENLQQARRFFERALALDPNNVSALVGEAAVDVTVGSSAMTDDPTALFAAAIAASTKALSVAPNSAMAHLVLGAAHNGTNRPAQAIEACEHALALDRNLAGAHAIIGAAKIFLGRAEETEDHILEALRLSPRDVVVYSWMYVVGLAKWCLGRDDEAVAWLRRSIEANRNWPLAHFLLSAALAHLGGLDEARAAAQAGLTLDPSFTIGRLRARAMFNPAYLAHHERAYDGMRMAGVPEG